jgi:hypothetical protein
MMIAETDLPFASPRARRSPAVGALSPAPGGFVFAVAALPGEAEGFRWPSWLSPISGPWDPKHPSTSSKRSR